ncbi:MAG TPA: hypothetical protein DCL49_14440 [Candidatus Omnitrophica bacterium]|nr:hypothetical protein [Candidatus Omnitrophota bacterium]
MRLELRGKCPKCHAERTVWGYVIDNPTSDGLDAMENRADKIGSVEAHCRKCDCIEDVAFFADGKQTEPWMNAGEYERKFGRDAGPLPPKPWRKNENRRN